MNWDAIGAVGEIVGAIAVVATLAYFGVQLRNSTRASEANNVQANAGNFNALGLEIAKEPDLRRVYQRLSSNESLSEFNGEDLIILEMILRTIFNTVHAGVHSSGLHGVDAKDTPDRNLGLAFLTETLLANVCVREWWRESPLKDHSYGPAFETVVNQAVERHETPTIQ